ncbi:hypothetical protein DERF_010992 [Dermatophagoides farinae]|uniref:Uncharacterized protein n=1 Tax=Dermatophagoides farinae TaxID=6954 RepID=A0A922HS12_DERFA|nr:hypothetical protein DERF_010992 [Dermatophagoides farinae]
MTAMATAISIKLATNCLQIMGAKPSKPGDVLLLNLVMAFISSRSVTGWNGVSSLRWILDQLLT